MALTFHPLANVFPLMEGREFAELVEDIRANGVREPAVLFEGQILDGRNRYRASAEAGVDCPLVTFGGTDPVAFVVSLNLRRRHLDESQRAMVAAKLATLPAHRPNGANLPPSVEEAAALLNVSERSVKSARAVRDHAVPELAGMVERGKVSVSAAADVARLPDAEQQEIVARGEREILEAAKAIRAEKAEARRVERVQKIAEISAGNTELGTQQRYPIIYADPPWQYENPPMGGGNRSIENHYPTMTLEQICALPVGALAADDAVLFMWATAPKLAECFKVIEAWGFNYRTNLVWDKEKIGMGYHARNQHELLLIAKRGEVPPPPPDKRPASIIREPRADHSAKPHSFYVLIDSMYPELSKIELFARNAVPSGWAAWGNQAEAA